jgi:glycosyltransferase involved in cell wall biosynthesis
MNPLRINIILPFLATKPGGGARIMYEYANRLKAKGHQVTVVHTIKRPLKKMKSPLWLKQLRYKVIHGSRPAWFPLHPDIPSLVVPEIVNKYVPDADISLCTWFEMALMTSRLEPSKGKCFNLIMGYETWTGHKEAVHESYRLPIHHVVIAEYLEKIVFETSGVKPLFVPVAIDTTHFKILNPVISRKAAKVSMLYSEEPVKDTATGIAALSLVKKEIPELEVDLFGVYKKADIPDWMQYHPKVKALNELFNQQSVFLSPSINEGWALPPAEAMLCGCALVCTDIGGHRDYAFDQKTALVVKPQDVNGMAEKIISLIKNDELRVRLASEGQRFIGENFNWQRSVALMEKHFNKALNR